MNRKLFIQLGIAFFLVWAFSACQKDDDSPCSGDPVIESIKSKVLDEENIEKGEFGDWLVILGRNFCEVTEVYFNDVPVYNLYVEPNLISVQIARELPDEDTKTITLVTSDGRKFTKDFPVVIPQLIITGLYNEYSKPGDTVRVMGDNFDLFDIDSTTATVKFGNEYGDTIVKIMDVTQKYFTFVVPKKNWQNAKMHFYANGERPIDMKIPGRFRDNRNVVSNDHVPPEANVVASDGIGKPGYPDSIAGNYAVFKGKYKGDWDYRAPGFSVIWNEPMFYFVTEFGYVYDKEMLIGDTKGLYLKFEINVLTEWYANAIIFSDWFDGGYSYSYAPHSEGASYMTEGWHTVKIPVSEFYKEDAGNKIYLTNIEPDWVGEWTWRWREMMFRGATPMDDVFICWDNLRFVREDED